MVNNNIKRTIRGRKKRYKKKVRKVDRQINKDMAHNSQRDESKKSKESLRKGCDRIWINKYYEDFWPNKGEMRHRSKKRKSKQRKYDRDTKLQNNSFQY